MTRSTLPRIPELLAPAGSREKMLTAIHYGADAVYLGGQDYSLRARAGNFDRPGIREAIGLAHDRGVRVFVTVNIFARNRDFHHLADYLEFLADCRADGLIIADPGIFSVARKVVPRLPIHVSTQANITNSESARFWQENGAVRVNLARELGLEEIREIRQNCSLELEVFVHGALCISYSGRCLLSQYLTGRDGNHGDCAHPCRYSYHLVEEKRPGQYFPVCEDERGTYIFNSKDLCLIQRLPELAAAGVDAVKIEGRMKSAGYLAQVVRAYRAALDRIKEEVSREVPLEKIVLPEAFSREMEKIGTRGRTENFFSGPPSTEAMLYDTMRYTQGTVPAAIVRRVRPLVVDVRSGLRLGDLIEYLPPGIGTIPCRITVLENEAGQPVDQAHPGTRVRLETEPEITNLTEFSLFRKNADTHEPHSQRSVSS